MTQWHQLVVDRSEGVDSGNVRECIRHFWDAVVEASHPPEIEVWHRHNQARESVFLFSPAAVELARACGPFGNACANLTPLEHAPDFDGYTRVL